MRISVPILAVLASLPLSRPATAQANALVSAASNGAQGDDESQIGRASCRERV